jgi:DNA-binding beta-propeller fold protein YncE
VKTTSKPTTKAHHRLAKARGLSVVLAVGVLVLLTINRATVQAAPIKLPVAIPQNPVVGGVELPLAEGTTLPMVPPKFSLTDQPGSWYDTGLDIPTAGRSLAVAEMLPGGPPVKATFEVAAANTGSVHTVTSLIRPAGSPYVDQPGGFIGTREVPLTKPGLYAFTCKIHPYMLGAVVVDDPTTVGLDFGRASTISMGDGGLTVPTASDIIYRLVHTFFVATVPANWQQFSNTEKVTWNPQYPIAPIRTSTSGGGTHLIPDLNTFFHEYFDEPKVLPALTQRPKVPGVGEVWIDTQFQGVNGKTKPGTATAVDVENWTVSKKIGAPSINMNNPHNMWVDRDHKYLYQTEWFSDMLDVFDIDSLQLIRRLKVGPAPSHVMTRTDTDQLHIAINGGSDVVEAAAGATKIDRRLAAQRPGELVAHPHAHWMSGDGKWMVTPDPNTDEATLFNVQTGAIVSKRSLEKVPIASSMTPDGSKYYIANLLSNSISCVSIKGKACVSNGQPVGAKTVRLDRGYDPISGSHRNNLGILPIQTPVSPDGNYMLTANTTSGTVTVYNVKTDTVVKTLPCDPGCHGINFGAKKGGGYYAYLSNKFSNALTIIDGDPNGDGNPKDAAIVGRMTLESGGGTKSDSKMATPAWGGQGVLAVPLVYEGWSELVPHTGYGAELTCRQRHPITPSAC